MHPNDQEDIHRIQVEIDTAKKVIEKADALERLLRNPDFQAVIDDGYFTLEARRLTLLLGDANITDATRARVVRSLEAVGELHSYIRNKRAEGEQMRASVAEYQTALDQIQAGGGLGHEVDGGAE